MNYWKYHSAAAGWVYNQEWRSEVQLKPDGRLRNFADTKVRTLFLAALTRPDLT